MLALGVQLAAHRQHLRRKIHQSHLELLLEAGRVVSAAAAELDHRFRRLINAAGEVLGVDGGLFGVVGGRRQ
jgi:hypothetical protein